MSADAPARGLVVPSSIARWGLVVALAFAALHGPYLINKFERNGWLYADGSFYFTTVKSLAEHGRLEQKDLHPTSWYEQDLGWNREMDPAWSDVSLGREDRWYPKHPILLPALSVPFYWLFGPPGTLVVNVLLNLAFILAIFSLCRRVARVEVAAVVATLVAAQQLVVSSSYGFSNDVLSGALLVGAFDAALGRRLRIAGIAAGFAIWARVTHVAFLPALALVAWGDGGWVSLATAVRWTLLPLGLFAVHNTWLFGAPWVVSYQRVLARVHGEAKALAVANNFTVPFASGFRKVVLGNEGAVNAFTLFTPGLLGLFALPRRRILVGVAMALFCVPYVLLLVKYDWYRPQLLYPVFGASALGLAAAGERILGENRTIDETTIVLRPGLFASLAVLVLVTSLAVRITQHRDPALLSSRIEAAHVFLGKTPCDYFNPQLERWECSHFDRGEAWMMTGRILSAPVRVQGTVRKGIWMHPHADGDWRRLVFDELPKGPVSMVFALGDASHAGNVEIELQARGEEKQTFTLSRPGAEEKRDVAIADGAGPALEIRVRSADPSWKHLVLDGRLSP